MKLRVDFWDVGQGDCSVITLPDDRLIIIDTGRAASSCLPEWLGARRNEIYGIIITHNDDDHSGCFPTILERFHNRIRNAFLLIDAPLNSRNRRDLFQTALRHHRYHGLKLVQLSTAERRVFGGKFENESVALTCAYPTFSAGIQQALSKAPKPNNMSAILCLYVNGRLEIIWPGDARVATVNSACTPTRAAVLVGPHHGSPDDKASKEFEAELNRWSPDNLWISVGTGNPHGHPNEHYLRSRAARRSRVICSQLAMCYARRRSDLAHVMHTHVALGLLPPRSHNSISCRGAMQWNWDSGNRRFVPDVFHDPHWRAVNQMKKAICLAG